MHSINIPLALTRSAFGWALALPILALAIGGCSDNDNDNVVAPPVTPPPAAVTQGFEVSVINNTAGQPFSPIAIIAHNDDYSVFTLGASASEALESMAEGGENAGLIAEADASDSVTMTQSAEEPLAPGGTETLPIVIEEDDLTGLSLSFATMLVNSNDAFTVGRVSLDGLEIGDMRSVVTVTYDAGTEANSEMAGTIPGPADGGEGFNADRNDNLDQVLIHSGALTADDGAVNSVLGQVHRWDNPVARFTVRRTE